ncbi:adenosylcobinamide-GDP ribazoletransferase [Clostridium acetobutylicum]|uniref:Adenosylcobinamide-GDP ribazoletransferase n=1 Tax=Clostridium acetobutylicum (strain ATCC 824 / DSM 792 / JCM 1419 / IAM 19013 / LMG 5710 / NBRC 13948 / NRRL B-527 / VKM B-1787 / 2291 / W) TaxID=272562 RepID=COBS_CLOAB|nr:MULTISPECIES: adenosylcobinamide-GDP ribazoletransferase [Clostridium]Q97JA2.1 RecName: Full=Adenosylcobinamide-GDP ribazoletransferase; AltName: Full=Cobalamin synthase; AltName: Full=Cobalamin-5'-phosphate synthase [Clostridium acetobutylicum ATCC 824]AAK79352.1 Cobalamin-5-phosphate synthase [Clostridium acetobutylicum ATCC 824]ADZ20435.1 cobalamin synthase [Clostridium acetobutylicum EA 2018]AEI33421.1 cobalamin synthase [Clostridium acetobutylicum DSM 1731]AWV81399.1 adenosylcobinamide
MAFFRRLILMIQFLTRIPIKYESDITTEDFGKALALVPIVGLIIGGIMGVTYMLLVKVFFYKISAVLVLIEYIFLTGGIHLDGLGDTFDGVFSNRPKERILEIMRDSRVGTNAVLAVISVIILNYVILTEIDPAYMVKVIILFPVAGRLGSIVSASLSTYARRGEGMGKSFIDYCTLKELAIGIILYAVIFLSVGLSRGYIIMIFPILTAVILIKYFTRKIGGATGDILGAVCELNQTFYLMTVYAVLYFRG